MKSEHNKIMLQNKLNQAKTSYLLISLLCVIALGAAAPLPEGSTHVAMPSDMGANSNLNLAPLTEAMQFTGRLSERVTLPGFQGLEAENMRALLECVSLPFLVPNVGLVFIDKWEVVCVDGIQCLRAPCDIANIFTTIGINPNTGIADKVFTFRTHPDARSQRHGIIGVSRPIEEFMQAAYDKVSEAMTMNKGGRIILVRAVGNETESSDRARHVEIMAVGLGGGDPVRVRSDYIEVREGRCVISRKA